MAELFRLIEQAFVVPAGQDGSIDVATESDFQTELRRAVDSGGGPDRLRGIAEQFLSSTAPSQDSPPITRASQYVDLASRLRTLKPLTGAKTTQEVRTVFGASPSELVGSDEFDRELTLSSDLTVAVKLTTGFDRLNAAWIATTRRVIAFLQDFVADRVEPLDSKTIRARLDRPLKVPQEYLPKAAIPPTPHPLAPRPDPVIDERQRMLKQQAALESAYNTLMSLHPSQLEVRTFDAREPVSASRAPEAMRVLSGAQGDQSPVASEATATRTVLAIPRRTLDSLDQTVRDAVHAELPDPASVSMQNVVEVVKRRWLEVSQKVEPAKLPTPARTYRVGLHLFAVQPPRVLPDMQDLDESVGAEPDFSHAVTRPVGIGNLQVVRQELIGYVPSDISHIENVLPGELMRRTTRREETNELTITEEAETSQSEERDLQSTKRNELASEAQKEASQQTVASQGETTTTSYGKLVENSKTNYARSVTDRAVNKVTQMVRQQRIQREKKVFRDTAVHQLDNKDGGKAIRGIYQWVDKKYKTRIMNVGKRLLYDVVVPEPAAFLVQSLKNAAQPENFQLVRPPQPYLQPSNLNAGNYMYWAALYGVTGSVSPPPEEFIQTVARTSSGGVEISGVIDAFGVKTFKLHFDAFNIRVPDNYKAISGYVQRTNVSVPPKPGTVPPKSDLIDKDEEQLEIFIGENTFLCFSLTKINALNQSFAMNGETGDIPVTLRSSPKIIQLNYAIGINCRRMDKALEQWQLKTHAAITAGYQRQRAEYLDQLGRYQAAVRQQMALVSNLAHDSSVEREELKKAFIHLLMSEHFPQVYIPTPNPTALPADPVYVKKWGAVVAFFERAFEWENLMYIYYPYFWGRTSRWGELILTQDADPQFEAFLRAGAARVVVPARPGFEAALAHYHETGDVWMGEEIPDMFSEQYVSIIAEIKARNALPDEEVCLGEWDVRLPTTLVMLKDDAKLPEWKPEKECIPPPEG